LAVVGALVAVQCVRLAWTLAAPLETPVAAPPAKAAQARPLGGFDPFFRGDAQSGPAVVTALDLRLHGVREDRATGRGSAIVATPDGRQGSFAVGEEIIPGVRLEAVGFDNVTISRGGAREQIFLDQSPAPAEAAPTAGPLAGPTAEAPPVAGPAIRLAPRMEAGRVTGISVMPGGDGAAFRAAGFAPGDVILSVDGQPIGSAEQARALARDARGELRLVVDRGGRRLPLRVRLNP
jgi:general secretion pathway protein C